MNSGLNRRALITTFAAAGTSGLGLDAMYASQATPETDDHDHDHSHEEDHSHDHAHEGESSFLLVGDSEAKTATIYSTADYSVIEAIEGVSINSHAGTIQLADGSVLFVDDEGQRLMHVEVHGDHLHIHEASTPGTVAHITVDSDHAHYCAVGTSGEDAHQLHLVDLETWDVTSLEIPDAAEVGLMMTHDHLFHRNSNLNQIEAYAVADLINGTVQPLSVLDIGTFGHGESINEETGELFALTDDGVDIAYWEDEELVFGKTLAWPESDPASRGFFCRLIDDGKHLLTYTSDRSAPETEWNTWKNRVVIYDIAGGEPIVTDLPDGYTFRYSLAGQTAVFTVIGGEGDQVLTLDIDPSSEQFGEVTGVTSLPYMTGGAGVGEAFHEVGAYRSHAILPDASTAFVSRGGDGVIDIIDTALVEVTDAIEHSSALIGGGTLAVFGPAVPFTDTIGR